MLAFSEFERDMIVERTQEGKAVARLKEDFRDGRPRVECEDFEKTAQKQKEGQLTVAEACKTLGISRATYYKRLKEVS